MENGEINLGKIAQEIQKLDTNNTNIDDIKEGVMIGENDTYSSNEHEDGRSTSAQMIVRTVELSQGSLSSGHNININNINITQNVTNNNNVTSNPNDDGIGNSPNNTSDHDTSQSQFEMITTTDFLGTATM